ncbi:MAG: CoA transferase [Dehalococcoidia bacterium]
MEAFAPLLAGPLLDAQINGRPETATATTIRRTLPTTSTAAPTNRTAQQRSRELVRRRRRRGWPLAVGSDASWRALCRAIDRPELANDPRFADVVSRKRREGQIDALLAGWAAGEERDVAVARLRAAGVPAAPVRSAADVPCEPAHVARTFFHEQERAHVGRRWYPGLPLRLDGVRPLPDRPAPTLGEHNREVLTDLLGLAEAEVAQLSARGVIGEWPRDESGP